MIRADILPCSEADALYIGAHMRDADKAEMHALGLAPYSVAIRAFNASFETKCGSLNGVPVCMYGVGLPSLFGKLARPWLMATDDIEKCRTTFLRRSRAQVADWLDRYEVLENMIDARNTLSIAWLKWLGFKMSEPFAVASGHKFMVFTKRQGDV